METVKRNLRREHIEVIFPHISWGTLTENTKDVPIDLLQRFDKMYRDLLDIRDELEAIYNA